MPKRKTDKHPSKLSAEDLINSLAGSPQYNSRAKQWMWLGVISISVMIFFLWGWSLKAQLSFFNWQKTPEKAFLNQARTNWDEIYAATKNNELKKELTRTQVKNSLKSIITNAMAISSSPMITSTTTQLPLQPPASAED